MEKYSITLNFLIPKKIVQKLKEVKIEGNFVFDWRDSDFCHCTLKAISRCNKIPKNIDLWSKEAEKILSKQKSFKAIVKNVERFPNVIFTNIHSQNLNKLHRKLFKVLPSSQPKFENERYVSHASIVVLSDKAKILSKVRQKFGEFEVKEIQLMIWSVKRLNKPKIYKRYYLRKV